MHVFNLHFTTNLMQTLLRMAYKVRGGDGRESDREIREGGEDKMEGQELK